MTFLPTLEQAQQIVAANPAFETSSFMIGEDRIHTFGYRLPGYMDFEEPVPGTELQAHELRGLTFIEHADGSIERFLMLRKFHALNQTKGHMAADIVGKSIKSVSEKMDGSIVRFIPLHGSNLARTKNSFHGVHARLATELLTRIDGLSAFVQEAHEQGLGPVFEMISPDFRIVVPYEETALILIQMRDEATGEYLDIASHPLVEKHAIRNAAVKGVDSMDDVVRMQADAKGVEGLVVTFDDGMLMKCKTRWYDDFHDFFFEKNRTDKKMVSMVLAETMDDALAAMDIEDPDRPAAQEAYDLIGGHINATAAAIKTAIDAFEGDVSNNDDKRNFVMKHKGDPMLGLYMQSLSDTSSEGIMRVAKTSLMSATRKEDEARKLLRKLRQAAEQTSVHSM